ncbi:MAG: hypothetical protein CVU69_08020 [Deltaproteobacteria bacterium HGW-Deltaproteobacteria-4]|nr:MAG: hypothetical protein CVU69_08020 [Deltaproteobacteria bacterium HGW-Deltaproteobacteria-4]
MIDKKVISEKYSGILETFFDHREEEAFSAVSELGKELVLTGAGPDVLIEIHGAALKTLIKDVDPMTMSRMVVNANDLLLNGVMAQLEEERRKLAPTKLEEDVERDKLDNIISALDADLLLLDRELTVLWVNKRLQERPQFNNGTIIGKPCNMSYCNMAKPPEDCPALIAFNSGQPVRQEHPITHPDGSTRYYHFTCSPIRNAAGVVDRVLELVQDVTERYVMEENLRGKNAELERFNKLFVDREFRIKELKDRVKALEGK